MANTYSQLYAQIIFSPKGRVNLINDRIKESVYKYILGVIKGNNQKPMIINGMPDHIHILIGFSPNIALSDLVRDIKANTTNYINVNKLVPGKFAWQRGFGAFSYSKSQISQVIKYINNQEQHHKIRTFREEYLELLNKFEIEFENKYLFEFYD
jgi:REP element-mobilizing transposase RayT